MGLLGGDSGTERSESTIELSEGAVGGVVDNFSRC